uniref:DUF1772 domain-containing protein n=1 Tax=Rheinheimera sp. BAL341 TaxID=1708203 RepID=A0A486XVX9_9GAMM
MLFLVDISQLLTVALLGLLAGALWAEGELLVPYWKTLSSDEFYKLHPQYAPRLFKFFAPITALTPPVAVVAALLAWYNNAPTAWWSTGTALLAASLIAIYFVYFSQTNAAFARAAISADQLAGELNRWQNWHRLRVVICMLAFFLSIGAISQ